MQRHPAKLRHSDTPEHRDITVACSPYYRMRADIQRHLKSSRALPNGHVEGNEINIVEAWRKANNLSQEELSHKAHVSIEEIVDIETGKFNSPMITYIKIAKVLRVHISMILGSSRTIIS
ncbi:helix-turn-helix transcriptional regulator [Labrys sp. KB_33_2]|uniref:helix-turn-helix transcriptional regulator n=1 Tax=Labrys sp. KB_33_2 TaxID=3237479 RepID=UPI003F908BF8